MSAQQPPIISSFVIRFVVEEPAIEPGDEQGVGLPEHPAYHGSIRHVQSDETINFSVWHDAVEFMRRYVPLDPEVQS
jgi:hypothetical protein